jgi:hypothetical protein
MDEVPKSLTWLLSESPGAHAIKKNKKKEAVFFHTYFLKLRKRPKTQAKRCSYQYPPSN